jgi:hypothetical protein
VRPKIVSSEFDHRNSGVGNLSAERVSRPENRESGLPTSLMSGAKHPGELTLSSMSGHSSDHMRDT